VIDKIWLAAGDGPWHSLRGVTEQTRLEVDEVAVALYFLVRYGFAEPSFGGEQRFRMIMDGPSPMEAADLLHVIEIEAD
jgi:hypothetical protein